MKSELSTCVFLLSNGDELHNDGQRKLHDGAEWKRGGRHRWNNLHSRCQRDRGNRVCFKIFLFLLNESSFFFSYINPDVVPTLQSPSSDVKANGRVLVTGGGGSLINAKNRATSEMEDESEEVKTSSRRSVIVRNDSLCPLGGTKPTKRSYCLRSEA